jgi:hypothetical protein
MRQDSPTPPARKVYAHHHATRRHAGLWRTLVLAATIAVFGLISKPAQAEVPDCLAEMKEVIRANIYEMYFTVCANRSEPWTIMFFRAGHGAMTDGTALRVFHMPQPDMVPVEEWPLPVVLMPKSAHVWYVGYMYKGEVLPEFAGLREFVWAPGNNRSGFRPDGVDWGDDAVRVFRCLALEGQESCVTYYPIRNCDVLNDEETDFFVQAFRDADMDVVKLLDTFGPADDLASLAAEAAWDALCKPGE